MPLMNLNKVLRDSTGLTSVRVNKSFDICNQNFTTIEKYIEMLWSKISVLETTVKELETDRVYNVKLRDQHYAA